MSERKQISRDEWPSYLSEVSAGNRGRKIAVDVIGRPDVSPERVSERTSISVPLTDAPFLALEYEPVEKGNAIIVSVGVEAVEYEHAVDAPVELTANLDADGRLDSLEILDQDNARTKLNFFG